MIVSGVLITLSYWIRIDFKYFYEYFGFYQGDIWYFYDRYGGVMGNFFYQIEYPVGYVIIQKIAYFMSGLLSPRSYTSFMVSNYILMLPCMLAIIYFMQDLLKDKPRRLLYFILSPSAFVFLTINYDIFPLVCLLAAIVFILKNRVRGSAVFLALGAVLKIYPGFLLPLFFLYLYKDSKKSAIIFALYFFATFIFINLPYMIYNFSFWKFPYLYQAVNPERADPTTISYYISQLFSSHLQSVVLLIVMGTAWYIVYRFFRKRILNRENFLFLALLICFSAVFGNHVYTPQYFLWFMPLTLVSMTPSILILFSFDLMNAASRAFWFKLTVDYQFILHSIWGITVISFVCYYIILIRRTMEKLRVTGHELTAK